MKSQGREEKSRSGESKRGEVERKWKCMLAVALSQELRPLGHGA